MATASSRPSTDFRIRRTRGTIVVPRKNTYFGSSRPWISLCWAMLAAKAYFKRELLTPPKTTMAIRYELKRWTSCCSCSTAIYFMWAKAMPTQSVCLGSRRHTSNWLTPHTQCRLLLARSRSRSNQRHYQAFPSIGIPTLCA